MACSFASVAAHEQFCRYCNWQTVNHAAPAAERERHYAHVRQVDVTHILLDVTPDFAERTVSGTATIQFKPIGPPLQELKLDGVQLRVSAVRASHAVRDHTSDDQHVTIIFAKPIPTDAEVWVEIDYSAEPQMGFYFRTRLDGLDPNEEHCWTQGEPHEARYWFPCIDSPNERSSSELICHVPEAMTVISNGRLIEERAPASNDGLKTVRWMQEKPHAVYLICLVAGRMEMINDQHGEVPLRFYTQPSKAAFAESAFRETADMMEFFEQEIGIPFPWEKYDQVTIFDFLFAGMENTTLTTLFQRAMAEPASENIGEARPLVAHELAHQWFGDYVTCKDWSHLWLNEGFAVYYSHLYEGRKFGRDALLYRLYRDAVDEIFPNFEDTRPIAYRQYRGPIDQLDFRAFAKGSWVLHMLRSQIGEDLYRQAVRTYLKRHALGEVETEDLRQAFEEVSGHPLDRFFDQWVYHGGFPELSVKYKWLAQERRAHISIDQTQDVNDRVLLFQFPTKLRFVVDGKVIDEAIEVGEIHQEWFVSLPAGPQIFRFDPDFSVLARVKISGLSDAMLETQLASKTDAIGRVLACGELANRKTNREVAALRAALQDDPFFGVRGAAADALVMIGSDNATAALADSLKQSNARVRRHVVEALGKCYTEAARRRLWQVVAEEPNPAVSAAAITGLARFRDGAISELLCDTLASRSFRNEKAAAAMTAIGERNDPNLAPVLMQTIRSRENELDARDLSSGMFSLAKISKQGQRREEAFEFLASYRGHVRELLQRGAIVALGELGDPRARELLEAAAADRGNTRLARVAEDALVALDKTSPEVPAELSDFRRENRELRARQSEIEQTVDELKAKWNSKADINPAALHVQP